MNLNTPTIPCGALVQMGNPYAGLKPAKRPSIGIHPGETAAKRLKPPGNQNFPEWYPKIRKNARFSRSFAFKLADVRTYLQLIESSATNAARLASLLTRLREMVHTIEYATDLTPAAVKHSKILEAGGLPLIVRNGVEGVDIPWDIRSNAETLFCKWSRIEGIDPSLLVGVTFKKGNYSFEKEYCAKKSCHVFGDNGLVNGQWWPYQISAAVHGAHGELRGGIHHSTDGAYSIVITNGTYQNVDDGDRIEYFGSHGAPDKPTDATNAMIKSMQNGRHVRVLRSSSDTPCTNVYLPAKGIRYDGLYVISGFNHSTIDGMVQHLFFMKRVNGQHPIRYTGVEKRPTDEEIRRLRMMRKARKGSA